MKPQTVTAYTRMADQQEGRYHGVGFRYGGRMVVADMAFGRAWLRFNPGAELVWIDDAEGRPRGLTPKQYRVLQVVQECIAWRRMTMRDIARELEVAPSTVSRAMTKLAAWGLIRYIVGRGRWSGLIIFRRTKDDGHETQRREAKARIRRWSEAAKARVSRLWINVAPYIHDGRGGGITVTGHGPYPTTHMDATLAEPWEVEPGA